MTTNNNHKIKRSYTLYCAMTPELKERLKKFCERKGISMTDFLESLISKSLKRN